jgi:sugar lactone lactonase YvrE
MSMEWLWHAGSSEICPDRSHMRHHLLPNGRTTNIAFGDEDLRTACVTLTDYAKLVALNGYEAGLKLAFNR